MGWRMVGKPYATADMVGTPTVSQKFSLTENQIIRGINAGVIFYNTPVFTSLYLKLYSDRGGSPAYLFATSTNSYTQAQCLAGDTNSYRILGFTFADIPARLSTTYHAVLYASGYTGDASSHIAWRTTYPDPQYRTGITTSAEKGANQPFEFAIISGDV